MHVMHICHMPSACPVSPASEKMTISSLYRNLFADRIINMCLHVMFARSCRMFERQLSHCASQAFDVQLYFQNVLLHAMSKKKAHTASASIASHVLGHLLLTYAATFDGVSIR